MQTFAGNGIMVTQNIDQIEIDFSTSLYHVEKEELKERSTAGILAGEICESDLDRADTGHITTFFRTSTMGPVRAKNHAMKMVGYILQCAVVGS
jgi:hypothetical protein